MELTEKKAISECKKLWGEIAKSGLSKCDFLDSKAGRKWLGKYNSDCPLCEYNSLFETWVQCHHCLLEGTGYERCRKYGYSYTEIPTPEWLAVIEAL